MNDPLSTIEHQLMHGIPRVAPENLRETVLRDVRRELRSAGWETLLAKAAAALLVIGIALNSTLFLRGPHDFAPTNSVAAEGSLLETAVAVARVTDIETARQVATQISAFNGHILTTEQLTALDVAIAEALVKSRKG